MSHQSRTVSIFSLAIALSLAAACTQRGAGHSPASSDTTMVVGTSVDAGSINQLTGGHSRFSQDIIDLLFLHLFEEQPDFTDSPPTFEPEIVREYSWSEDRLSLRLDLRDDIVWSDGWPLTAEDVRWTFEAQTSPEIGWSYAHSKQAIESVRVLGPHSVVFRFSHVSASRLADVNQGVILPKHLWSRLPFAEWRSRGDWFLDNLAVSGPYSINDWHPQHEIVLDSNPRFHLKDRPRIPRIVFRVVPDRSQRLRQLLSGALDFVEKLERDDIQQLSSSDLATTSSYWHRQYSFIVWNACKEPFSNPGVRRALTLGIDRRSIVETLFDTNARIGVSPIPQSVWAFNEDIRPWPYDPERASQVLTANGWRDSDGDGILDRNGIPLSFQLTTNGDNQTRMDAGLMIRNHLARIGIEVRLVPVEFNTLVELNMAHDFDASIGAWGIDTSLDLGYAFHSRSAHSGYNYGCYSNREVDALIDDIRRAPNLADTAPLIHDLQVLIHREQPYTFLWEPLRVDGVSRRLTGVASNPLSAFFDLEEWHLAAADS